MPLCWTFSSSSSIRRSSASRDSCSRRALRAARFCSQRWNQLSRLRRGVVLSDGPTLPAEAEALVAAPEPLWPRDPPIRFRKNVPDAWLRLTIREGRNRQVRRMTAAAGLPTLRLIRVRVGPYELGDLAPGQSRVIAAESE